MKKLVFAAFVLISLASLGVYTQAEILIDETFEFNEAADDIVDTSFGPDDNFVAYASVDGNVYIYYTVTGGLVITLTEHSGEINAVAFSPDGNHIAYTGSDENVYIHETENWGLTDTIPLDNHGTAIDYKTNSKHLAVGDANGDLLIFDTATYENEFTITAIPDGDETIEITEPIHSIDYLHYEHDGVDAYIAYAAGDSIYIRYTSQYRTDGYGFIKSIDVNTGGGNVQAMEFQPIDKKYWSGFEGYRQSDTYIAYVGSHDTLDYDVINFHNLRSGDITQMEVEQDTINTISYGPDGKYILAAGVGEAYIYNTNTKELDTTFTNATNDILTATFSPNHKYLAYGTLDNIAYLHDISFQYDVEFVDHDGTILDEQTVVHGDDAVPPDDPTREDPYYFHNWGYEYIEVISYGSTLESDYEKITEWYLESYYKNINSDTTVNANYTQMPLIETIDDATSTIWAGAYSPDGEHIAYGGPNDNVYVYDTETYTLQETLTAADETVFSIAYSPDGSHVAYGIWDKGNVYVYDTETYEHQATLSAAGDTVYSIAYSPDGSHIAYGGEENVYVYDTETYTRQETLTAAERNVYSIAYSPDGSYIAYGTFFSTSEHNPNVYVYDTETYTLQEELIVSADKNEGGHIFDIAYSPDGNHIAFGSRDYNVYILDTETYTVQETLTEAKSYVRVVEYSPDGSQIAYSGSDPNVYVHDTDTYTVQEMLIDAEDTVRFMDYTLDGNQFAYGGGDNTVYIHSSNTAPEYTVRFEDYDGTLIDEQSVEHGDDAVPPEDPTRDGYTFDGWQGDYTNITSDTTITATYLEEYTVEFVDHDGTILDEQKVVHGDDAVPPDDPTREDPYYFDGWDTDYTNINSDTIVIATYDDTRPVQEVINSWLVSVGLDGPFGSMFITLIIMAGVSVMAAINRAPLPILILINLILLLLAVLLGFIPAWALIGIAMVIMLMIYIVLTDIPIGGGNE